MINGLEKGKSSTSFILDAVLLHERQDSGSLPVLSGTEHTSVEAGMEVCLPAQKHSLYFEDVGKISACVYWAMQMISG